MNEARPRGDGGGGRGRGGGGYGGGGYGGVLTFVRILYICFHIHTLVLSKVEVAVMEVGATEVPGGLPRWPLMTVQKHLSTFILF